MFTNVMVRGTTVTKCLFEQKNKFPTGKQGFIETNAEIDRIEITQRDEQMGVANCYFVATANGYSGEQGSEERQQVFALEVKGVTSAFFALSDNGKECDDECMVKGLMESETFQQINESAYLEVAKSTARTMLANSDFFSVPIQFFTQLDREAQEDEQQ